MLKLLGKKIGMTHIYKSNGVAVAVTMIELYDNKVISSKSKDGSNNILIGFNEIENSKNIRKPIAGFFRKKNLPIFKSLKFSKIKDSLQVKEGDSLEHSSVIKKGDKISVKGVTSGKGFSGVMKRWNFRGLEASHGVSISHRSHGSTGQRQDPGKTFKGKKMAGHLGVENMTAKNLQVEYVDNVTSMIAVRGSIPGKNGSEITIKLNNF